MLLTFLGIVQIFLGITSAYCIKHTYDHQALLRANVELMGKEWVDQQVKWWDGHRRRWWFLLAFATGLLTATILTGVLNALR